MQDDATPRTEPNASNTDAPEWSAGDPIAARDVDPEKDITLGSAVRVPLLLGLTIALLTATCLGVPTALNALEDALGAEFSDGFVDLVFHGTIPAVLIIVVAYATGRHRLRNWLAERRLGDIHVDAAGHKTAGATLDVSITSRHLHRARGIGVIREVVRIDGLRPDQRAQIVAEPGYATPKRNRARARPVLRAGDDDVAWRSRENAELDADDVLLVTSASATFPITEALAHHDALFQRLRVDIDMPWWWFGWRATVMIWESQPETSAQSQSESEASGDEPLW